MKKELFELVKKEFKHIVVLLALGLIIFKIAFFKEELIVIFRYVLSLFWLFVLPGYFIMLYWQKSWILSRGWLLELLWLPVL